MSRVVFSRMGQAVIDLGTLAIAFWVAFLVRFDGDIPPPMFKRLVFSLPYVVALEFGALTLFGVRRFAWRYVGLHEVGRVLLAVFAATSVLLAFRLSAGGLVEHALWLRATLIPTGVIAINVGLAFLGVVGVRAIRRLSAERSEAVRRRPAVADEPTILVGAGQAGVLVARELAKRSDLGMLPVGFVDDDLMKQGVVIQGLTVLGPTSRLAEICSERNVKRVLITMANASGAVIRNIVRQCEDAGISAQIIPGIYEIVGGTVNLSRIRPIAIEDLLRRDAVALDIEAISARLSGRTVCVTGAGGSIGSELCRQLCGFGAQRVILIERSENALFNIHRELLVQFPDVEVIPAMADICDRVRIRTLFEKHPPVAVFHAAAHKHVPMMEWNAGEAVKNNVFGTKTLADIASECGVDIFVQISTDKAVRPTSVMGASKRMAEMYLQSISARSETRFVTVRFGNVLGSAGSVVPIFREQIAAGGPVHVTHADMRRYFMLTAEACQLVLQAASFAEGGEIFVLDMGEPVKILDLARDMIRLSGYEPDVDIKIEFSGIRPGEKLFEELLSDGEGHDRTVHSKILVGRIPKVPTDFVEQALSQLRLVTELDSESVFPLMIGIITELDSAARRQTGFVAAPVKGTNQDADAH